MHIAIVDVLGSPYDGSTASKRGLGGSESAVIFIARELVKLGMNVTVFNDCTSMDASPGTYDSVRYESVETVAGYNDLDWQYDVVISSRSVNPFVNSSKYYMPGAKNILWLHDTFCDGDELVEQLVVNGRIDEVWTLSDWHTNYISQCNHGTKRMMEVLKRKIWQTRNGVNIYRDVDFQKKDPNHFVFNAAVNKGMKTLLEDIWPKMRDYNHDLHLTVIGGAYPLKNGDLQTSALAELIRDHHLKNNVKFSGIISQREIADILADASFMIYPQTFPETYGISTVESLAYGTPVITGRFGAMEETAIEDACYLMDYPVDSNVLYTFNKEDHVNRFVNMAIDAHQNNYLWQQKSNKSMEVREICGWDKVALQWKQHLYKITGRYLDVEEYRTVTKINHKAHRIFSRRWSNPEEWGYYPEEERKIHVIVPFYNAESYLQKCIDSIVTQNYKNYMVYLIDDASTDGSAMIAGKYQSNLHFDVQYNQTNVGALVNQIACIRQNTFKTEDIIMMIDGDDALVNDNNIFKKINALYSEGAEMTYGSCWSMADNIPLIAQEYPDEVHTKSTYREHKFPWNMPYTHLRTFSYGLFQCINLDDLKDENGKYFRVGHDLALFYALIEAAEPDRVKCVKEVVYLYNDLNPINDYKVNSEEQTRNANYIMRGEIKKKKILIAIPTNKNIHPETFRSIYNLYIPDGYETELQFFYGYCVDQVRNLIADWMVKGDYEYLFAVDYDISFDRFTLVNLLSHNKDIVSGLYIQRKPDQHILEIYRTAPDNGAQYNVSMEELLEEKEILAPISGCGFGCVLVKSEVFKAIPYPHFTYHHAIRMEDTVSEDVDFCNKARAHGFKIYADTSVLCRHHGETVFTV
jgi:glycosyltransferase involved in cell wall biosynthesis